MRDWVRARNRDLVLKIDRKYNLKRQSLKTILIIQNLFSGQHSFAVRLFAYFRSQLPLAVAGLQRWSEITVTTTKNGIVLVATSNVKLFSMTIW